MGGEAYVLLCCKVFDIFLGTFSLGFAFNILKTKSTWLLSTMASFQGLNFF